MSSVSLASVQRQHSGPRESWLATCPIYKWAVLSLTSSKPKMSCLHLARVQSPFQDGSSSVAAERLCRYVQRVILPPGNVCKISLWDTGMLNKGCFIGGAINCTNVRVHSVSYNTGFAMYKYTPLIKRQSVGLYLLLFQAQECVSVSRAWPGIPG